MKAKSIGVLLIVIVVLSVVLYMVGSWQGKKEATAQKEHCLQQLKERDSRLVTVENQVNFFKARTALFQTALDLDQRNFGLANAHLREADDPLARLNDASLGISKAVLDALRQEIARTNIQVAIDLEAQRNQILNFERRLDSLLPRPSGPTFLPTSPTVPAIPAPSPVPKPAGSAKPETR